MKTSTSTSDPSGGEFPNGCSPFGLLLLLLFYIFLFFSPYRGMLAERPFGAISFHQPQLHRRKNTLKAGNTFQHTSTNPAASHPSLSLSAVVWSISSSPSEPRISPHSQPPLPCNIGDDFISPLCRPNPSVKIWR